MKQKNLIYLLVLLLVLVGFFEQAGALALGQNRGEAESATVPALVVMNEDSTISEKAEQSKVPVALTMSEESAASATNREISDVAKSEPENSTVSESAAMTEAGRMVKRSPNPVMQLMGVSGDNIDFAVEPSKPQTQYKTNVGITSGFFLNGERLSPADTLYGAYVEIEVPTLMYVPGKDNRESSAGKYLDSFNITAADNIDFIDRTEVFADQGKTYFRIYFKTIDSTTRLKFPYVFSFTDGLVPNDFVLQPVLRLYTAEDVLLKEDMDLPYTPYYPKFISTKYCGTSTADKQLAYGGTSAVNDSTRIAVDGAEPVPFSFNFSGDPYDDGRWAGREIDRIIVTDSLPAYENSRGEMVYADFNSALNPGWVDNENGTVSFVMEDTNWNNQGLGLMNKTILYLSFPDAKFKDGEVNLLFKN